MGGGKGGSSQKIYDYLMSIDYGICHGPIDSVNFVIAKEKYMYVGPATASGAKYIEKKKLFGGDKGEGGAIGTMEVYLGSWGQRMSTALAARYELTPTTAPGYRGIAHLFFRGGQATTAISSSLPSALNWFGLIPQFQNEDNNPTGWVDENGTWHAGTPGGGDTVDDGLDPEVGNDTLSGSAYGLDTYFGADFSSMGPNNTGKGFTWTTNNPYLPGVEVGITRSPVGLAASPLIYPIVGVDGSGEYIIASPGDAFDPVDPDDVIDKWALPDANPAAMIYECMTNGLWGKGELESAMDKPSYEYAAGILAAEHFGLSMRWMAQDDHEKVIGEIQDHIDAFHFQHPQTGLWTLKLVRDDYVAADAMLFDPTNCDAFNIKRVLWDETINEIVVSYTDPESEEEETVSAQNLASIAIIGGVRSDPRDYHGVRNPWLAKWIAERDVAKSSRSLTSATLHCNREAAALAPGDVIRFTWPNEQISEMVMRVMSVEPGKSKDRVVKIEVTEDIFAVASASVPVESQEPVFQEPTGFPQDLDRVLIMAPPYPALVQQQVEITYPQSAVVFFGNDADLEPNEVHVVTDVVQQNGVEDKQSVTSFLPTQFGTLGTTLQPGIRSAIPLATVEALYGDDAESGDLIVIGDSEDNHEIVMLDFREYTSGRWIVARGIYDTIPETWASTDRVWAYPVAENEGDPTERVVGEEVDYNFIPQTPLGVLQIDDSTTHTHTVSNRPWAPHRPGDVEIDGNGFDHTQYLSASVPTDITVTWANRNRTTEDAVAPIWDDATIAAEVGQTTTIRFYDSIGGVLDHEVTGLTGTSEVVPLDDFPTFRFYDVVVFAVRDGIESIRQVTRTLEVERLGYGNNYGYDYGENDGG